MAINKQGLFRPKFGALFTTTLFTTAQQVTGFLALIQTFTLTGEPPASWVHWGHLSRTTLPANSVEGGESTSLSTWLEMNTDSFAADLIESDEYTLNQLDAKTVSGLSALNGQRVTAAELWSSGTARYLKFWPASTGAWSQGPLADNVDDYAGMKFRLSHQLPDATVAQAVAQAADPDHGIGAYPNVDNPSMLIFDPTAFTGANS